MIIVIISIQILQIEPKMSATDTAIDFDDITSPLNLDDDWADADFENFDHENLTFNERLDARHINTPDGLDDLNDVNLVVTHYRDLFGDLDDSPVNPLVIDG